MVELPRIGLVLLLTVVDSVLRHGPVGKQGLSMPTCNEYVKLENDLLAQFALWWESMTKKNPETYPDELDVDEWDEQFKAWLEVVHYA